MTDAKPFEQGKSSAEHSEKEPKTPDLGSIGRITAAQLDAVKNLDINRHSGSADGAAGHSIEIDFGDGKIASRLTGLNEKSADSANAKQADISISISELLELQEKHQDIKAQSLVDAYEVFLKMPRGSERDIKAAEWQESANMAFNRGEQADVHSARTNQSDKSQFLALEPDDLHLKHSDDAHTSQGPAVWYHQPIIEAKKIMHQIESLEHEHKLSPYSFDAPPEKHNKCNIFLYDVMDRAGVPLPHGANNSRLSVANLDAALAKDPNFEKVWCRSQKEETRDSERLRFESSFRPLDGDCAIWNNRHMEHTCLLEETIDGTGNTYYAGSDTKTGFRYTPLREWWIESTVPGYGAPNAVYRYKHFERN